MTGETRFDPGGSAALESLVTAFHSMDLARGLAHQTGASFAAVIACDDDTDTIVDVYPQDLGWTANAPAPRELLEGQAAGTWMVMNPNLRAAEAGTLAAHLADLGFVTAAQVCIGKPGEFAGRIVLASLASDWRPPEPGEAFGQMLQALWPYLRHSARSAQRTIQRQMLQAQKMESLGSMAGMIAHDFNNLLTTVLGYTSLLKISPTVNEHDRESLELIENAAHKAADLSGRLLTFARGGLARFGPLDLRSVVHDATKLAEPAIHERIALYCSLPDTPVPIEGDGGQMQQAILNIVLNAVDAMPEGGVIDIALGIEGGKARLVIADDGPGMAEETQVRIFEPFYTTKPIGSGSGLGMAITYGIVVQSHEGQISLETAPGEGARFTVELPLLEEHEPNLAFADPAVDTDLVLIVDDDDMVRRATGEAIKHLGYNAVEASTGRMAIELVRARPERFSVVLLDLVMPELTGAETFRELQKIREDLPVIVCTGYASDGHIDAAMRRKIAGLVQKPFTPERLRAAIAEVAPALVS